jgi:hypothetical protein
MANNVPATHADSSNAAGHSRTSSKPAKNTIATNGAADPRNVAAVASPGAETSIPLTATASSARSENRQPRPLAIRRSSAANEPGAERSALSI